MDTASASITEGELVRDRRPGGGGGRGEKTRGLEKQRGVLAMVQIESLRPTQMAVGMRSVALKRRKIETRGANRKNVRKLLSARPIPAVKGPGGELFIIDHHHFGLALWHAQVECAYARVIDDLSHLAPASFFEQMERDGRLYPFDELGERIATARMPTWLHALRHDPFRDLAWQVREKGGFRKVAVPYAEFRWGNYFREHIALNVLMSKPDKAFASAMKLCREPAAQRLPGFKAAKA